VSNSNSIHELALWGSGWSDEPLPIPPNVIPVSEAFGHRPPIDDGSVLFRAKNLATGETNACEIRLPTTSSWTASIIGNQVCGGHQHTACSATGAFCELATGACATVEPTGACLVKPTVCNEKIFPACGCDGKSYASDCERQAAGVPKWSDGPCSSASCPATEPVPLTNCTPANISCVYTSPTEGCSDRLTCSSGVWSAPVTVCGF
jgi:hypothetical protein